MIRGVAAALLAVGCGRIAFDPRSDGAPASLDLGPPIAGDPCGDETSLVACFTFEGNTDDISGRGNHASGTAVYTVGRGSVAAMFDDTTNVRIPDSPSMNFSAQVTVMAWVRHDTLPSDPRAVIIDRNQGFAFFVRDDGGPGFNVSTGGVGATGSADDATPLTLGTWTHLAATFDGSVITLYVNGTVRDTSALSGSIANADTLGTRIGGNLTDGTSAAQQPFYGAIDDLGVWNEALQAARIVQQAGML